MSGKFPGFSGSLTPPDIRNIFRLPKPDRKQGVSKPAGRACDAARANPHEPAHPPDALVFSSVRTARLQKRPPSKKTLNAVSLPSGKAYMPCSRSVTPIAKFMEGTHNSSYTKSMNSSIEIYTQHFELKERPFTLLPDPDFLFWSPAHQRAFTMLEYGTLTGAPITLITGEVGAGKTTLLHHFLKSLDDNIKVGMISNAHGSRGELLRWVLMALDQPASNEATYVDLFDQFQEYLIKEYAAGNRVLLIFDEAQNLSQESLEELRMFTNINSNKDELLQLVLVGQPELREIVQQPSLRQFAQRVASSFHLNTMDEGTTLAYIGHRLKKAGAARNLFTESASRLVHKNTHGVPRLVNQLCDLSMVYAFAKNQKTVTLLTVEQVLEDGAFFGAPPAEQNDETA